MATLDIQQLENLPAAMSTLNGLKEVIIRQRLMNFEIKGYHFSICDTEDNQFMKAVEIPDGSSSCWRFCCSKSRPFVMQIKDNDDKMLIELGRPYRCRSMMCCCCLQLLKIRSPLGMKMGKIKQNHTLNPCFTVRDAAGNVVCEFMYETMGNFKVVSNKAEIGKIYNMSHVFEEGNLSGITNVFKITFPEYFEVMKKALILCSSFLVDFNYMDNSMIKEVKHVGYGVTYEVVFYNCKYKFTERSPNRFQTIINPLF